MKVIDKTFELYSNKINTDYSVVVDGILVPTQAFISTKEDEEQLYHDKKFNLTRYSKQLIDKLSPDKIDSRIFWSKATSLFPLFSVAGALNGEETIENVNITTLSSAYHLGALKVVDDVFIKNKEALMLEIGPGHGNLLTYLKNNYTDINYHAIDVNPLFSHPRIYQTTGSTISNSVPNKLDLVYSINVFQHLSKKQRSAYYKRVYRKLKDGGVFVFGMFVETQLNKNWPVWGVRDFDDRYYVNFFKQLTIVDREYELIDELSNLGFKVEKISPYEYKHHYLTYKCRK